MRRTVTEAAGPLASPQMFRLPEQCKVYTRRCVTHRVAAICVALESSRADGAQSAGPASERRRKDRKSGARNAEYERRCERRKRNFDS
eukprot:3175015-Pleurochrysis_carterae.AAC.1